MNVNDPWAAVPVVAGLILTLSYLWLIRDIVRTAEHPIAVLAALVPAIAVLPAVLYALYAIGGQ